MALTGGPRIDGGYAPTATRSKSTSTTSTKPRSTSPVVSTATRTYDPTKQMWVDSSQATVKTIQETYDPTQQMWVTKPPVSTPIPTVTQPPVTSTWTPPTTRPTEPPVEVPTEPPVENPPPGPGGSGNEGGTDLGRFTEQEIEAALAALEAQYGMTREQLLMDQTQLGAQARLLMARMERQRQLGVQAAESDAVGRGIYRSGILGENIQGIENQYQEGVAQAEQQRLAQEQAIQTQLQFLQQQKAAEAAQIQAGILRSSADYANQAGISAAQAGLQPASPLADAQNRYVQTQLQGAGGGMAPISVDPRGPLFLPQGY